MDLIFEQILNSLGIAQETIEQARQRQAAQGGSLRENLIALNVFTEETFAQRVSKQLRVPYVDLEKMTIADNVLNLLPREKAEKYLALPLELPDERHRRLNIAMANPTDMSIIDELKFVIGYTLILHYAPEDELSEAIQREYSRFENKQAVAAVWTAQPQPSTPDIQGPVIDIASLTTAETEIAQFIGAIFTVAYSKQANEIHIAPDFDGIRVCFRIEGKLSEIARFPKKLAASLIPRIKRVLGFEARVRLSQRGSATIKLPNNKELDLSYQIYPTSQYENVLIKIKDRFSLPVVEDFDLEPKAQNDLQKALDSPQGMVLAAGTAKSGLTTTLYALLKTVNKPHLNVISVEDPIECVVEGVTQGQVDEESGHTYEQYLQYVFSQRPDVVMLDKMFDAQMAQKLLLFSSGSLVLSSLSAEDTASAATKLIFISNPKLVVDHVNCITSQRLVRKICESCKEEVALSEAHREKLGLSAEDRCYSGKGCDQCGHTGYKGFTSIFEVMPFTEDVKRTIMGSGTAHDLRNISVSNSVLSLRDDGMRKVKQGITTVQEVLKATML
jgi:type IV pilus assembly protein PilB